MTTINNSYQACGIIEGFTEENPTTEQTLEAWAYLIRTGQCWQLQGFYGRGARNIIESGVISKHGEINWDTIKEEAQI